MFKGNLEKQENKKHTLRMPTCRTTKVAAADPVDENEDIKPPNDTKTSQRLTIYLAILCLLLLVVVITLSITFAISLIGNGE